MLVLRVPTERKYRGKTAARVRILKNYANEEPRTPKSGGRATKYVTATKYARPTLVANDTKGANVVAQTSALEVCGSSCAN